MDLLRNLLEIQSLLPDVRRAEVGAEEVTREVRKVRQALLEGESESSLKMPLLYHEFASKHVYDIMGGVLLGVLKGQIFMSPQQQD